MKTLARAALALSFLGLYGGALLALWWVATHGVPIVAFPAMVGVCLGSVSFPIALNAAWMGVFEYD